MTQSIETAPPQPGVTGARILVQSALVFGAFGAAQMCSFLRNALLGHSLAIGDFGTAATITLMLQLIEASSDLGADRLIVQADDGDDPRLLATAHSLLLMRGLITALIIYLVAGPVSGFFGVEHARWAFEAAASVPLVKAFLHLDQRRRQRRLDNVPYLIVEVAPQVLALLATLPVLMAGAGYSAVVWLGLMQAAGAVAASHLLASERYRCGWDGRYMRRLFAFGWPIWLSAIPLIAVYQGDRFIVGPMFGIEALAGYSAAFMMAMVPGLVAARAGQTLMLPLLARVKADGAEFIKRTLVMAEITALVAALYLVVMIVSGGGIVSLAFGPNFKGLDLVMALLGGMWALRMVQAVPGMALMALGHTRAMLIAGSLRSLSLGLALVLASAGASLGYGLEGVAAAGIAGEFISLFYLTRRVEALYPEFAAQFFLRLSFLIPAAAIAALMAIGLAHEEAGAAASLAAATGLCVAIALIGIAAMPMVRDQLSGALSRWRHGLRFSRS